MQPEGMITFFPVRLAKIVFSAALESVAPVQSTPAVSRTSITGLLWHAKLVPLPTTCEPLVAAHPPMFVIPPVKALGPVTVWASSAVRFVRWACNGRLSNKNIRSFFTKEKLWHICSSAIQECVQVHWAEFSTLGRILNRLDATRPRLVLVARVYLKKQQDFVAIWFST